MTWYSRGPFRCLIGPRHELHFLANAIDLVRFTGGFILVLIMIKILFLQKFEIFFGFAYLFAVYKANMFICRIYRYQRKLVGNYLDSY